MQIFTSINQSIVFQMTNSSMNVPYQQSVTARVTTDQNMTSLLCRAYTGKHTRLLYEVLTRMKRRRDKVCLPDYVHTTHYTLDIRLLSTVHLAC